MQRLDTNRGHLHQFGLDDLILLRELTEHEDELAERFLEGVRLLLVRLGPLLRARR